MKYRGVKANTQRVPACKIPLGVDKHTKGMLAYIAAYERFINSDPRIALVTRR